MITQENSQAMSFLFPNSFLYSFEQSDLWLSLTFLPSSETTTQIRYDIFNSSPKAIINVDDLVTAVDGIIKNLISVLEAEYKTINNRPVENSPFVCKILQNIQEHSKLERIRGEKISPAMHKPKGSSLFQQAEQCKSFLEFADLMYTNEEIVCKEIDCSGPSSNGSSSNGLEW